MPVDRLKKGVLRMDSQVSSCIGIAYPSFLFSFIFIYYLSVYSFTQADAIFCCCFHDVLVASDIFCKNLVVVRKFLLTL